MNDSFVWFFLLKTTRLVADGAGRCPSQVVINVLKFLLRCTCRRSPKRGVLGDYLVLVVVVVVVAAAAVVVMACPHWRLGNSCRFWRQSPNWATIVASVDRP